MSGYELIVFDWDGTIMDSTALIASCIQAACRDVGMAVPADADARFVIGLGHVEAVERVAPGMNAAQRLAFTESYRRNFLSREHEAPLFPGIRDLLGDLKGRQRRLAVATGKSRRGLDRALDASGLRPFFEATRCADEGLAKPHPDMLLQLLEMTGVEPSRAVMIGDTTHDLELAANAGVDAVAVCYGAHADGLLRSCPARHFARSVPDLGAWLQANA
jgi:phosphoglycolate phosphatase